MAERRQRQRQTIVSRRIKGKEHVDSLAAPALLWQNLVPVALNQIWKVIKGNRESGKIYIRHKVPERQIQKKILVPGENLDQTRGFSHSDEWDECPLQKVT